MALKFAHTNPSEENPDNSAKVDLLDVVENYPGPCLLLEQDGTPAGGNAAGRQFYDELRETPSWREFSISLAEVQLRQVAVQARLHLWDRGSPARQDAQSLSVAAGKSGLQIVDLTLVPLGDAGTTVLVLVRDVTFDQNLISALTASRSLYRDLVSCSSDFYWESDDTGNFTFVGVQGALGYSARELNGMNAGQLSPTYFPAQAEGPPASRFDPALDPVWYSLLQSHTATQATEVCLRHRNNELNTFSVSVVPVFDKDGRWRGVRGAARNITEIKQKQSAVERANLRHQAISRVVEAMRSKLHPEEKMEEAANATLRSFESDICLVYRLSGDGDLGDGPAQAVSASLYQEARSLPPLPHDRQIAAHLRECLHSDKRYFEFVVENWRFMAAVTALHEPNGVVCIGRPFSELPPVSFEPELLKEISHHVGITIAHVEQILQLRELARKDPLTNLLNRRAFLEDAEKRLAQHRRQHREAGLLCIDFDYFKRINDELGHKAGDATLVAFAQIVGQRIRLGDLFARLGGDEFCIWLEEVDLDGAIAKARLVHNLRDEISQAAELPFEIGISMGIAIYDPDVDETIDQLIVRADNALIQSKANQKNSWTIAGSPVAEAADKILGKTTC